MLAKHLHDAAIRRHAIVDLQPTTNDASILDLEDRGHAVRVRLVGTKQSEIFRVGVSREDVSRHLAKSSPRLELFGSGSGHSHCIVSKRRKVELAKDATAVRIGIRTHPPVA